MWKERLYGFSVHLDVCFVFYSALFQSPLCLCEEHEGLTGILEYLRLHQGRAS